MRFFALEPRTPARSTRPESTHPAIDRINEARFRLSASTPSRRAQLYTQVLG